MKVRDVNDKWRTVTVINNTRYEDNYLQVMIENCAVTEYFEPPFIASVGKDLWIKLVASYKGNLIRLECTNV